MKEPGRLTAKETTAFEYRLLDAGRRAGIPNEMSSRMSQGLGFGAKAAVAGGALVSLKAGGLIALSTVAIIGVAATLGGWFDGGEDAPRAVVMATEPATPAAPMIAGPQVLAPTPVAPPSREPAPRRTDGVREELTILEQARAALAAGAADRALELLGRHDRRYPRGTFRPEAIVLRVEALARRGETEKARALANRFLAENPDSPLAERVGRFAASGR